MEVLLTQPDGTTIPAVSWGDESRNGYETTDGYTVVQTPEDTWVYASGRTKNGKLKASAVKAERKAPSGTPKRLRPASAPSPEIPASPPGGTFDGTQRSLVLLVDFPDQAAVGTVAADWNARFFGATNSVADFYDQASYGALSLVPATESHGTANDGVVGWLTMPYNHPNTLGTTGTANQQLAKDAIEAANPYVDFAAYDTNGDGSIESRECHITVIVAGYETAYGGASAQCGPSVVGPQVGPVFGGPPAVDGKSVGGRVPDAVYGYTQFGEWHCYTPWDSPGHMATLGIIAHELGHDLGWPDLYDIDGSSYGVGKWSLMGSGNWNFAGANAQGSDPALPDAFLRSYQGWSTPVEITGSQASVPITAASAADSVKRLGVNPGGVDWSFGAASGDGEYFLVENRQKTGYDAGLPGCGILIWHIDETRTSSNYANADETRKLVDLAEADGLEQLDLHLSQGNAGDPYPGSPLPNQWFDGTSNPNSNWYSGSPSVVVVHVLDTTCSPTMSVDLTGPSTNTSPVAVDDAYSTPEDTVLNEAAPGVLANDTDVDLDPMTAVLDTDVIHGSLTLNLDGSFDYTPDTAYVGTDSFTYHADDGTADSNIVTVDLTVTGTVMVGAGDIADCGVGAGQTAALINALPSATVFTLGDNAYSTGTITEYTDCYEPSWGAFKDRTYPSIGNHYAPNQTTGYFPYFSATPGGIGSPDGYYSYDQGPYWHVIVLNTEVDYSAGSAQEVWLRADSLRMLTRTCWPTGTRPGSVPTIRTGPRSPPRRSGMPCTSSVQISY